MPDNSFRAQSDERTSTPPSKPPAPDLPPRVNSRPVMKRNGTGQPCGAAPWLQNPQRVSWDEKTIADSSFIPEYRRSVGPRPPMALGPITSFRPFCLCHPFCPSCLSCTSWFSSCPFCRSCPSCPFCPSCQSSFSLCPGFPSCRPEDVPRTKCWL